MGVLAQAKNGNEQFWNMQNFMQPMGRLSTHVTLIFFLFSFGGREGGGGFFVPFKFPKCSLGSQCVPQGLLAPTHLVFFFMTKVGNG
jgi:hypothetical protein